MTWFGMLAVKAPSLLPRLRSYREGTPIASTDSIETAGNLTTNTAAGVGLDALSPMPIKINLVSFPIKLPSDAIVWVVFP